MSKREIIEIVILVLLIAIAVVRRRRRAGSRPRLQPRHHAHAGRTGGERPFREAAPAAR